jgi:prepilin-type N-terminal cleavage/methylation domain-containing protein
MVKFNQTIAKTKKQMNKLRINSGFTLTELLVTIVILGILTSLSAFSWNSWQRRTAESEVKSDLTVLVSAMKNDLNFKNAFPTSLPSSFQPGSGVTITYSSGSATTYCIDGVSKKRPNITMFVNEDGRVKKGTCAGGEIADYYSEGSFVASNVSAGLNNGCAISLGKIYCWGNNAQGQLGNGTASGTVSTKPVAVDMSGALSGKTVTAIASGYAHNCALASGAIYCWGYNAAGQLGDGSNTQRNSPVQVNTSGVLNGKTITSISAGRNVTCAVASNQAYCWGENQYGQLGNNSAPTASNVPVAVSTAGVLSGGIVSQIDVGIEHVCAIAGGEAYCWGANYDGRLGNGGNTQMNVPVRVNTGLLSGKTVTQIDAGHYNTCATASGLAYCWGENDYGQLGNNTMPTDSNVPVAVSTAGVLSGKTVSSVSFNTQDGCALANGQAYCWGRNSSGSNGNGGYSTNAVPVAVNTSGVLNGKTITKLVSGANFNCALATPSVYCWGSNAQGNLGDNSTTTRPVPVKVVDP